MVERNMAVVRDDGYIENIIVVDGAFDPGPGKMLMDAISAQIGGTWDGTKFLPSPPLPTNNELAAAEIDESKALTGLVRLLGEKFTMTEAQMIDAITAKV